MKTVMENFVTGNTTMSDLPFNWQVKEPTALVLNIIHSMVHRRRD